MIENSMELRVAVRQLRIMERTLNLLREQLQAANPALFEVTSRAYTRRIACLQEEIAKHLATHPAAVSLVLPRLDDIEQVIDSSAALPA